MSHLRLVLAGEILTPHQKLKGTAIRLSEDGKIAAVGPIPDPVPSGPGVLDARDALIIPGLVDLQVNGALGWSFQAADRDHFDDILGYHLARGTTTMLPTLITAAENVLVESLAAHIDYAKGDPPVSLPGMHIEGPFLSPEKSGAHDQGALCTPDLALARRLWEAAEGRIAMFTLAPELPGAEEVIAFFAARGTIVSAGHSAATYRDMQRAIAAGLRFITHAGNASDWPHRAMGDLGFMTSEPGLVGSLMAERALGGAVILDGYHFHPALLPPLLKIKGPQKLALVSDASTVAGLPPGDYTSGGLSATIHPQGFATSGRGGGWLAGSTITLLDAVQRSVRLSGLTLQDAVTMATLGPARWLNLPEKGEIGVGKAADILILNDDLDLWHVIKGGQLLTSEAENRLRA